jgi:hypothetical protein
LRGDTGGVIIVVAAAGRGHAARPERGGAKMQRTRRRALGMLGVLLLAGLGSGCGSLTQWRLAGEWQSERLPKRTLVLRQDGTYLQRFSGQTLGFVSDLVGPETGKWSVDGGTLVLVGATTGSEPITRRLAIDNLERNDVSLDGEHWHRVR